MRDHRDDGNPADWLGGLLLIVCLVVLIVLPQLVWWLVTGDAMRPDGAP